MLEANYKTFCSEQSISLNSTLFATRLDTILQKNGYSDKRAAQMDVDDILQLLHDFHSEHIHFA